MRALQARCMPNIVGQKITRLDLVRVLLTIDAQLDSRGFSGRRHNQVFPRVFRISRRARPKSSPITSLRYSAVACISVGGLTIASTTLTADRKSTRLNSSH